MNRIYKSQFSILISYAMVFSVGCKTTHHANSNVADVPTKESAYDDVLSGYNPEDRHTVEKFIGLFRENKDIRKYPFVVLNFAERTVRTAKEEEVFSGKKLPDNEEVFIGKPFRKSVVGMKALPRVGQNNNILRFAIAKYDLRHFKSQGTLKKTNWVTVSFATNSGKEDLEKSISKQLRRMNSFFQDPDLIDYFADAQDKYKRLTDELSETETKRRDIDHPQKLNGFLIGGGLAAGALVLFLVLSLPNIIFALSKVATATEKLAVQNRVQIISTVLIVIAVGLLILAHVSDASNRSVLQDKINNLNNELEKLRQKYGLDVTSDRVDATNY